MQMQEESFYQQKEKHSCSIGSHGTAPHSAAHARWESLSLVGLGWARLPGGRNRLSGTGYWAAAVGGRCLVSA
jgi:hypothetical protein